MNCDNYEKYWYKRMTDALSRQDPVRYAEACRELGILIEDSANPDLYKQGENILNPTPKISKGNGLEKKIAKKNPEDISRFLEDVERSGLNLDRLSDYPDLKREILQRHFEKYQEGGKQDITAYSDGGVGKLLKNVYYSYKIQRSKSK